MILTFNYRRGGEKIMKKLNLKLPLMNLLFSLLFSAAAEIISDFFKKKE